jgi:hypothetical protein
MCDIMPYREWKEQAWMMEYQQPRHGPPSASSLQSLFRHSVSADGSDRVTSAGDRPGEDAH